MLEYSKTIGSLLGNPDSLSAYMIDDPKMILKVTISMCHIVSCFLALPLFEVKFTFLPIESNWYILSCRSRRSLLV